jgi:hypothetical protein
MQQKQQYSTNLGRALSTNKPHPLYSTIAQVPVYGTSTATSADPYDERGYAAIPPCLYGAAEDGLEPEHYLTYDQVRAQHTTQPHDVVDLSHNQPSRALNHALRGRLTKGRWGQTTRYCNGMGYHAC